MNSDNKVLSQDQIDDMLGGSGSSADKDDSPPKEPEPPAASAPVAKAPAQSAQPPMQPAPTAIAQPGAAAPSGDALAALEKKLEALSARVDRMAQLESALAQANSTMEQLQQDLKSAVGHVQLVNDRVEGILDNLKATIGYKAQKTFTCNACHAQGEVAARIRCTHCGQENWWGWYPPKK